MEFETEDSVRPGFLNPSQMHSFFLMASNRSAGVLQPTHVDSHTDDQQKVVGELAVKYRLSTDTVTSVLAHFSMAK
jgi:hypothetical protein